MPTLTITKTYLNGNILTETDLDNIRNSLTTFFNTTGIDSTNVQTGGLLGTNLANSTITQNQLASGSVGSAQLTSSAVQTAAIGPLAVTGAQLAANSVSQTKLALRTSSTAAVAVGGIAYSLSSGSYGTTNTTPAIVTNLSVTITTMGRPVLLSLQSDGGTSFVEGVNNSTSEAILSFLNGATVLNTDIGGSIVTGGGTSGVILPPGAFRYLDLSVNGVPGTYTYSVQAAPNSGSTLAVRNCILVAFEI